MYSNKAAEQERFFTEICNQDLALNELSEDAIREINNRLTSLDSFQMKEHFINALRDHVVLPALTDRELDLIKKKLLILLNYDYKVVKASPNVAILKDDRLVKYVTEKALEQVSAGPEINDELYQEILKPISPFLRVVATYKPDYELYGHFTPREFIDNLQTAQQHPEEMIRRCELVRGLDRESVTDFLNLFKPHHGFHALSRFMNSLSEQQSMDVLTYIREQNARGIPYQTRLATFWENPSQTTLDGLLPDDLHLDKFEVFDEFLQCIEEISTQQKYPALAAVYANPESMAKVLPSNFKDSIDMLLNADLTLSQLAGYLHAWKVPNYNYVAPQLFQQVQFEKIHDAARYQILKTKLTDHKAKINAKLLDPAGSAPLIAVVNTISEKNAATPISFAQMKEKLALLGIVDNAKAKELYVDREHRYITQSQEQGMMQSIKPLLGNHIVDYSDPDYSNRNHSTDSFIDKLLRHLYLNPEFDCRTEIVKPLQDLVKTPSMTSSRAHTAKMKELEAKIAIPEMESTAALAADKLLLVEVESTLKKLTAAPPADKTAKQVAKEVEKELTENHFKLLAVSLSQEVRSPIGRLFIGLEQAEKTLKAFPQWQDSVKYIKNVLPNLEALKVKIDTLHDNANSCLTVADKIVTEIKDNPDISNSVKEEARLLRKRAGEYMTGVLNLKQRTVASIEQMKQQKDESLAKQTQESGYLRTGLVEISEVGDITGKNWSEIATLSKTLAPDINETRLVIGAVSARNARTLKKLGLDEVRKNTLKTSATAKDKLEVVDVGSKYSVITETPAGSEQETMNLFAHEIHRQLNRHADQIVKNDRLLITGLNQYETVERMLACAMLILDLSHTEKLHAYFDIACNYDEKKIEQYAQAMVQQFAETEKQAADKTATPVPIGTKDTLKTDLEKMRAFLKKDHPELFTLRSTQKVDLERHAKLLTSIEKGVPTLSKELDDQMKKVDVAEKTLRGPKAGG